MSLWDLHYAFYCAIVISLVRYYLVNPFFAWMAIRTVPLSRLSLHQLNTQRAGTPDHIPDWVFPQLQHFLERQSGDMKRAKKSGKQDVIIDSKLKSQKQWKEVERSILTQLTTQPNTTATAHKYTDEDVRRWLSAYQHDQTRKMKIKKFQEAGWGFSFYTFIWIWGLITISDKNYFTKSIHLVWADYPMAAPTIDVTWYYWLSMGHYIHLFCAQFADIKRKDFVEMVVHHIVTLLLLTFSWMVNFTRIGALVLAVHDGCDVFLQLAKLFNYMHLQMFTDATFAVFAITFFVCRLIIFPGRIIYSSLVWTVTTGGYKPWFVYYFFNGLLLSLLVLHFIWFSIIMSMLIRWLRTGEMKKDARSDTDDGSASDNETNKTDGGKTNGGKAGEGRKKEL